MQQVTYMVEGIVLSTKDLLQGKFIATLFSKQKGVIPLLCYGKKYAFFQTTFPTVKATLIRRKSDLFAVQDASFLRAFQTTDYDSFEYAAKMVKSILESQLPLKPSENLYQLFARYLHKLSLSPSKHLWLSFQLKLLLHEGLFLLSDQCIKCGQKATNIEEGSPICLFHASKSAFCFNAEEWEALKILAHSKLFSELFLATIDNSLQEKIEAMCFYLFKEGQW